MVEPKVRILAAICGVAFLLLTGCGGGSGGDSSNLGDLATLSQYTYTATSSGTLHANFHQGGAGTMVDIGVDMPVGGFHGSFFTTTDSVHEAGEWTLEGQSLAEVTLTEGGGSAESFTIRVETKLEYATDGLPTTGQFRTLKSSQEVLVTVNPDADGTGVPGVTIENYENSSPAGTTVLTWPEMESLSDSTSAPSYAQLASLAFGVMSFVFEQVGHTLELIDVVTDNNGTLEAAGSTGIALSCEDFSAVGETADFPLQGTLDVAWMDSTSGVPGVLGDQDKFAVAYSHCWKGGDNLLGGSITLESFILISDIIDGVDSITDIGFGNVKFGDLIYSEVLRSSAGTYSLDPSKDVTVNGDFTLLLSQ